MQKFKIVTAKVQFMIDEKDCECSSNEEIVSYLNNTLATKTTQYGNVFNDSIISVEDFIVRSTKPPTVE